MNKKCVVKDCIHPAQKELKVSYFLNEQKLTKIFLCLEHLEAIEKGKLPAFSMGSSLRLLQKAVDKKIDGMRWGK
jgi:hypothetical protein